MRKQWMDYDSKKRKEVIRLACEYFETEAPLQRYHTERSVNADGLRKYLKDLNAAIKDKADPRFDPLVRRAAKLFDVPVKVQRPISLRVLFQYPLEDYIKLIDVKVKGKKEGREYPYEPTSLIFHHQ